MNKEEINKVKESLMGKNSDKKVTIYQNDNNINYSVERKNNSSYQQSFRIVYPLMSNDNLIVETDYFNRGNDESLRKLGTYNFDKETIDYRIDKDSTVIAPSRSIFHYINLKKFMVNRRGMHLIQSEGVLGSITHVVNTELVVCNNGQIRDRYNELMDIYTHIQKGDIGLYNILSSKISDFEKYITTQCDDYDYVVSKTYKKKN